MHERESILENETAKILNDFEIQSDYQMLINKKKELAL